MFLLIYFWLLEAYLDRSSTKLLIAYLKKQINKYKGGSNLCYAHINIYTACLFTNQLLEVLLIEVRGGFIPHFQAQADIIETVVCG